MGEKDVSELSEFMRSYWEAASSCDFDLVKPFISEEASFFFTEGAFNGIDQIEKSFENTWAAISHERYSVDEINWPTVGESLAFCTYRFTSEGDINGTHRVLRDLGTNILERRDAKLLIVHEHLGVIPD